MEREEQKIMSNIKKLIKEQREGEDVIKYRRDIKNLVLSLLEILKF